MKTVLIILTILIVTHLLMSMRVWPKEAKSGMIKVSTYKKIKLMQGKLYVDKRVEPVAPENTENIITVKCKEWHSSSYNLFKNERGESLYFKVSNAPSSNVVYALFDMTGTLLVRGGGLAPDARDGARYAELTKGLTSTNMTCSPSKSTITDYEKALAIAEKKLLENFPGHMRSGLKLKLTRIMQIVGTRSEWTIYYDVEEGEDMGVEMKVDIDTGEVLEYQDSWA